MNESLRSRLQKITLKMDAVSNRIREAEELLGPAAFVPCTVGLLSWDPKTKRVLSVGFGKPLHDLSFNDRSALSVGLNDLVHDAVKKAEEALARMEAGGA